MTINYEFVLGLDGKNVLNDAIRRVSDGALIPFDNANADYQQYLIDTNGGLPFPEEQA